MKSKEFAFLKEIEVIKNDATKKNYETRIDNEIKLLDKKKANVIEENQAKHKQAMELEKLVNENILKNSEKK